ncbi:FliH/SctL family protein [Geochorda subterranea]|uniref:FliH/SctL family protein n=1 Tax=Geochorda subterranea TaxID=3109564 RepID=A0ABZ1BKL5_9FIRM|nr:FliH/SctL family protein [Limnochorda sp. LNt]WRP13339.1 FliH/SctL family protein [Limnochorda sp. LNt]
MPTVRAAWSSSQGAPGDGRWPEVRPCWGARRRTGPGGAETASRPARCAPSCRGGGGARAWANEARQRARQEAQAIREAARAEGWEAGRAEGEREGRAQAIREVAARLERLLGEMIALVEEARRRRDHALALAEEDVVKLALAVAERVVRREVAAGPAVTRAVLQDVLREMPGAGEGRVVVRVHPDEHRLLADADLGLPQGVEGPVQVQWRADPEVEPGGCIVEAELGSIDAGLETRLVEVAAGLLDVMRHGR